MQFWEKKIGLITGGSAGLGLNIAREFSQQDGLPVLVARNLDRLKQAQELLAQDNLRSDYIVADMTNAGEAAAATREVAERHGTLDLLVNNIGRSIRSDILKADPAQYRDQIETNLMTAVNATLPAIPMLTESSGHIVNVGSLSSKFPWPLLGPYTASKFALAGFSHQLRMELPSNIHVLLVCPGPIQRLDAGKRYQEQAADLPESAQKPGAGVRLKGIAPDTLARKILAGCRRRKPEIIVPSYARLLSWFYACSPSLGDWMVRRFRSKD